MQVHVLPESLWRLLSLLLDCKDGPVPEVELQCAAQEAYAGAKACPQLLTRLQELLDQHGLCQ